ncbi:MAG: porin family protein [bacterium]
MNTKAVVVLGILYLLSLKGSRLTAQKFDGGLMGGGNVSQVAGDLWEGFDKVGFQGGGFVVLDISRHSSFQMELEFIQKGSRKNADYEKGDSWSYKLRLNYIEIPILYQYNFLKRLSVEIGPAFDILVGSYEERYDGYEIHDEGIPLRTLTFNAIIGVSCYITKSLKVNFRTNNSILSIRDGVANGYKKRFFDTGQYNDVLSLSLFYQFKGKPYW